MSYLFLTTVPFDRTFSMEHPCWLYILPTADDATASLTAKIYYTDATNDTKIIPLPALVAYAAIRINIAESEQDYTAEDPAKTISYIEIYIDADADKLTLRPYYPSEISDSIKALYYRNSLAGWDALICTGEHGKSYTPAQQIAEQPLPDTGSVTAFPQYLAVNQKGRRGESVNTGYKPKLEIEALMDMFHVNDIRLLSNIDGQDVLVPVMADTSTQQHSPSRANLHALSFSYLFAFDDRALDRPT